MKHLLALLATLLLLPLASLPAEVLDQAQAFTPENQTAESQTTE